MNIADKSKILLIDDNVICRDALHFLFNNESDFIILDDISSYNELQIYAEIKQIDLILLSYLLPKETIESISEFLMNSYPEIPLILFKVDKADGIVLNCLKNGLRGIVLKTDSKSTLQDVCKKVIQGERYLGNLDKELEQLEYSWQENQAIEDALTKRELEVIKLFANGFTYKEIGMKLHISPRTVESHKNNIQDKLGFGSLKELISFAIKNDIV